jgi:hypothetical protein
MATIASLMLARAGCDGIVGTAQILDLVRFWVVLPSAEHGHACAFDLRVRELCIRVLLVQSLLVTGLAVKAEIDSCCFGVYASYRGCIRRQ